MFIAALFTISKIWKQPKYPLLDKWIKKIWNICTMEYYTTLWKEENLPFPTMWMDLESIVCVLSRVWLCDPMDCSPPASSVGFPRQGYWSELPFAPPRDLPNPGIKLTSPAAPALAGGFFYHWVTWGVPRKALSYFLSTAARRKIEFNGVFLKITTLYPYLCTMNTHFKCPFQVGNNFLCQKG